MGASDPTRLGATRSREGHHRRASLSGSDPGSRRGAVARSTDAAPSRKLLVPAPAGPVLHPLAGLSPGSRFLRTGGGRLVRTVLAAGVVAAVVSCGSPASDGTTTWWQGTGGASACGPAAVYRINSGPIEIAGGCAGFLAVPATHVVVAVGSKVDVHITEEAKGSDGNELVPIYPTPSSNNPSVLESTSVADGGSTESFLAVGPGTADLMTTGLCALSPASANVDAPCPMLQVGVS
jgi:hypothetical protein